MGFYKNFLIGNTVILIILLAVMAVILSNKNNSQTFPATISECPDFYSMDPAGMCVMTRSVYSKRDARCTTLNARDMGISAKKTWAADCGVAWDGITNSSNI
jgi:hypothetical protein